MVKLNGSSLLRWVGDFLRNNRCDRKVPSLWPRKMHGPRRTRFVGPGKVQIQLWLTATAMNVKRTVRTQTPLLAGVAAARIALSELNYCGPH